MEKIEIKFRGLTKKGVWIYGMPTYDFMYIFNDSNYDSFDNFEVIPKTVSQYSGLKTTNGVEVYEGDACLYDRNVNEQTDKKPFIVYFENSKFIIKNDCEEFDLIDAIESIKVIGNIYQNPELLKS